MTTPEQTLWREVLALAVQDALKGITDAGQAKLTKIIQTHRARSYLTTANDDLHMVCALADLDPTAVREAMIKRIAAEPTPEELFADRRHHHSATIMLTHNGETHDLNQWSKIIGISKQTLRNRHRYGWPTERILTTMKHSRSTQPKPKAKPKSTAKLLTHEGHTRTIAKWSKATGIPQTILHMRERMGWSAERILTTPYTPRGTVIVQLTYEGQTLTIAEWSERLGLAVATIKQRLRNGLPIARVLSAEVRRGRPRGVASDFGHAHGTGGGTNAQETPNITFQEQTQ